MPSEEEKNLVNIMTDSLLSCERLESVRKARVLTCELVQYVHYALISSKLSSNFDVHKSGKLFLSG